jgi:homoserine kinase type II
MRALSDTYKRLGIFSTEMKALEAMKEAEGLPRFRDYPSGFSIDVYEVDKPRWTSRFTSDQLDKYQDR